MSYEKILKEAFKQGQQWGIDATEGKAPIGFTEWFKSKETQALILTSVNSSLDEVDIMKATEIRKDEELKSKFSESFFEDFQYDTEFRKIFEYMLIGLTSYEAIEYLFKSKKELFKSLVESLENKPMRIVVSNERFEELKTQE